MKTITINNEVTINAEGKKNSGHCKPVVCQDLITGKCKFYTSIEDAAEKLEMHPNYISVCVNGEKVCGHFRIYPVNKFGNYLAEFVDNCNKAADNNGSYKADAEKWREQKAKEEAARKAEEERLAAIRKAEEERIKAEQERKAKIEKAEARLVKRNTIIERLKAELARAEERARETEEEIRELEEFEEMEEQRESEGDEENDGFCYTA